MRITFVLPTANLGGGTKVIAIYARQLKQRGHDVTVVSTPPQQPGLRDKLRAIVKGTEWPGHVEQSKSHLDGMDLDHRVIDRYRPIVGKDVPDADVVIATWWQTAEWVAKLPKRKGTKAYFIQGYETWGGPPERVEATWRLPMHKIVISKWLMEMARDRYGDPHGSHVPNSVDTEQFHAPPRGKQATPTVGMLYSIADFKGCDVSLAAFARAAKEIPGLRLETFGKDAPTEAIPLPASAKFTKLPPQDRIRDIYAKCDVWLCGSRSEGFHLPPLEAMACRCPVVSTRVGGPMDVIEEGVNGFLAPIDDVGALTEKLLRVLRLNETRWRAMSDAAYATATRYSWDEATELFEAALVKAASAGMAMQPAVA